MVNIELLRKAYKSRGKTRADVAKAADMDASTFSRKIKANGEGFTVGEVSSIVELLHLSRQEINDIFFA